MTMQTSLTPTKYLSFQLPVPVNKYNHLTTFKFSNGPSTRRVCTSISYKNRAEIDNEVKCSTSSRRAFLQALSIPGAALLLCPGSALAYSSPYRPGQEVKPLPDRLYERSSGQIVKTDSGLQYFDLAVGNGTEATDGSTVWVNYTSRLRGLNGIKVSSSFDDPQAPPFMFRVGELDVVPGINEAVCGMRVGGKRRAVLPPSISYSSPDMKPAVTGFFARRRLLSVLETNRDATIVFE